jgi:hypothetical protein
MALSRVRARNLQSRRTSGNARGAGSSESTASVSVEELYQDVKQLKQGQARMEELVDRLTNLLMGAGNVGGGAPTPQSSFRASKAQDPGSTRSSNVARSSVMMIVEDAEKEI